jgi:hypothetical protein
LKNARENSKMGHIKEMENKMNRKRDIQIGIALVAILCEDNNFENTTLV